MIYKFAARAEKALELANEDLRKQLEEKKNK